MFLYVNILWKHSVISAILVSRHAVKDFTMLIAPVVICYHIIREDTDRQFIFLGPHSPGNSSPSALLYLPSMRYYCRRWTTVYICFPMQKDCERAMGAQYENTDPEYRARPLDYKGFTLTHKESWSTYQRQPIKYKDSEWCASFLTWLDYNSCQVGKPQSRQSRLVWQVNSFSTCSIACWCQWENVRICLAGGDIFSRQTQWCCDE